MYTHEEWVVVDTETTGLRAPVHAVEIAAQRMRGWRVQGEPFRMLLNHDVAIESSAEAQHGYSRQYLAQHGLDPVQVHQQFRHYVGERPIASHNLSFDWRRVLYPEARLLGLPEWGTPGFCTLMLARRLIYESKSHRLSVLLKGFHRGAGFQQHQALADVEALISLLRRVLRRRLNALGIIGLNQVTAWSRSYPVAACAAATEEAVQAPKKWYVLTADNKAVGPYRMRYIAALSRGQNWSVTFKGAKRWFHAHDCQAFQEALKANECLMNGLSTKAEPGEKPLLLGSRATLSKAPLFPKLKGVE